MAEYQYGWSVVLAATCNNCGNVGMSVYKRVCGDETAPREVYKCAVCGNFQKNMDRLSEVTSTSSDQSQPNHHT
jgi:formate dehydrogenase maturation protein FdhE